MLDNIKLCKTKCEPKFMRFGKSCHRYQNEQLNMKNHWWSGINEGPRGVDKLHFLMQFIGSTFFVWSSPLGERTPNEKDVDVFHWQIPLTASQIETCGNLNTTPIIFIFRMMANFCRKSSQLISRRIKLINCKLSIFRVVFQEKSKQRIVRGYENNLWIQQKYVAQIEKK